MNKFFVKRPARIRTSLFENRQKRKKSILQHNPTIILIISRKGAKFNPQRTPRSEYSLTPKRVSMVGLLAMEHYFCLAPSYVGILYDLFFHTIIPISLTHAENSWNSLPAF